MKFAWIDLNSGPRLEFIKLLDSKSKEIDSDVTLAPQSLKDLNIVLQITQENSTWHKIETDVEEAIEKRDIRLLGEIVQLEARLCWNDATKSSKEVRFPLGAMIKELTNYAIENPVGAVIGR